MNTGLDKEEIEPSVNGVDDPSGKDKLTDWAKEPTLETLKGDLEMAKESHGSQMTKIKKWKDLRNVEGSEKPKVRGENRSKVQPKLVRRQAEWRYPALTEPFLNTERVFETKPTTAEDVQGAKQNQLLLNWQFRTKLNRVAFIDNYVRATVDEGTSIVRLGWNREVETVQEEVPEFTFYEIESEEEFAALNEAMQLSVTNPRGYDEATTDEMKAAVDYFEETNIPAIAEITGTVMEDVEKVINNHPTATVLNPQNVYIDPTCEGDPDKALFVIESFETNYAELIKDKDRYKNLDKVGVKASDVLNEPDHETTTPQARTFKDRARRKLVAYEYWGFYDIEGKGKLEPIVATWVDNVLIRMERNPFPDQKLPYVVVPYNPVLREVHGEADAELLGDNQRILGAVTRGMIDLLGRSANSQQGFAKGMLDPLNRRRFDNGDDYEFNPQANPQLGHIQHKFPEFPQSALSMINMQNQEAEALSGVKSFAGGMSGESYGEVAAGIRGVLDAAGKREMAILRRLALGMQRIGEKIAAMNAVWLSEIEVVRVTNEEYVEINREDLKGNYDFIVDISTAEIDNAKAQDLGFMLQTMGNNLDFGITQRILVKIANLKRMPDLAKAIEEFQPQPDPMEQKLKELQIQKEMKEIEKLDSEIAYNHARAEKAAADADAVDLDIVEQESGTKHLRDVDKMRAQAEGNQELEVTKGLLKPKKEGEKAPDVEAAVGWNAFSQERQGKIQDIPRTPLPGLG